MYQNKSIYSTGVQDSTNSKAQWTPSCAWFTNSNHSANFMFQMFNVSNGYGWALIKKPLVAPASAGYGLDDWISLIGTQQQYAGQQQVINSGYRNPQHNKDIGSTYANGRHMFGDAVDLKNISGTQGWSMI